MKTVWLLDVDGVINGSRAGWSRQPATATAYHLGNRYRLRHEPMLLQRIHRLALSGLVKVRWSTTWNDAPGELSRVFPALGPFPHAFEPRLPKYPHLTYDELKVRAALDVLAAGDRLIWTDDSVVGPARNMYLPLTAAEARGQALLIAPNASRGLRPDDMDDIEAFAAAGTQEESLPEPLASS